MALHRAIHKNATLWMGDVDQYMDEPFVECAFRKSGENVVSVKIMRNKTPGCASYCFVEFSDQEASQKALLKLNGKIIPDTHPPVHYKLNHSSYGKENARQEYSLFVGDLTDDVDDLMLYSAFSKKYSSIRGAKVVHDPSGRPRGYGFVRFGDEEDQQRALNEMNLTRGVGKKLMRVSLATPRKGFQHNNQGSRGGGYNQAAGGGQPSHDQPGGYWPQQQQQQQQQQGYNQSGQQYQQYQGQQGQTQPAEEEEEEECQDPEIEVLDVDKANKELMERSEELYTALEGSRWHPLDNVMSTITMV